MPTDFSGLTPGSNDAPAAFESARAVLRDATNPRDSDAATDALVACFGAESQDENLMLARTLLFSESDKEHGAALRLLADHRRLHLRPSDRLQLLWDYAMVSSETDQDGDVFVVLVNDVTVSSAVRADRLSQAMRHPDVAIADRAAIALQFASKLDEHDVMELFAQGTASPRSSVMEATLESLAYAKYLSMSIRVDEIASRLGPHQSASVRKHAALVLRDLDEWRNAASQATATKLATALVEALGDTDPDVAGPVGQFVTSRLKNSFVVDVAE